MSSNYIFEIDGDEGGRIDSFISENIENVSRSFVQKHIRASNVLVNGKEVRSNYKLREGDAVEVKTFKTSMPDIIAEEIPLKVLYEDKDVIMIDKPKGMVVHPAVGHYSGTLVNALMYHCKNELSGINGVLRPGIVHRIDMDTSGVLVAAKNDAAHKGLSEQFAVHSINRIYEAITINVIKDDNLIIDRPIGRNNRDRKKMCVTDKNAKKAVTHIKVITRFSKNTFVEARLETGRTHQIRVHLSHMGYPLLGDTVYGSAKQNLKTNGQALFAKTLGFRHPITREYMEFSAERPLYMEEILQKLT